MTIDIFKSILEWMFVLFGVLVGSMVWIAAITFTYRVTSDFYKAFKEAPEETEREGEDLGD